MLKQLIEIRKGLLEPSIFFQQHIFKLKNCVEVLGFKAKGLRIADEQIVSGYLVDNMLNLTSIESGSTTLTLLNDTKEATVQVTAHASGEMSIEITPYVAESEIVPVYFRPILANTVLAIDLKGALKSYLVKNCLMGQEEDLLEVHYQSMHPNVLKDSYLGNFVLGCHKNGDAISATEEFALSGRMATLSFSKIKIQHHGFTKTLEFKKLLTFSITDYIMMDDDNI